MGRTDLIRRGAASSNIGGAQPSPAVLCSAAPSTSVRQPTETAKPRDASDAVAAIRCCIETFAAARSSRGVWQRERALAETLGGSPIDMATAAAARRLGE